MRASTAAYLPPSVADAPPCPHRLSCDSAPLDEGPFQAGPKAIHRLAGVIQRAYARGLRAVISARTPGAHRRAAPQPRGDEAFPLETLERRVDGARRDVAVQTRLHFFEDGATVGPVAKPHYRQEHRLFERAEDFGHFSLHCRLRASAVKRPRSSVQPPSRPGEVPGPRLDGPATLDAHVEPVP